MNRHNDNPSKRRSRTASDPLTRARRRDLAATLERDHARETRIERRRAELDRVWDRRYA